MAIVVGDAHARCQQPKTALSVLTKAQVKALGDQMQELLASVKATEKHIRGEKVAGAVGR